MPMTPLAGSLPSAGVGLVAQGGPIDTIMPPLPARSWGASVVLPPLPVAPPLASPVPPLPVAPPLPAPPDPVAPPEPVDPPLPVVVPGELLEQPTTAKASKEIEPVPNRRSIDSLPVRELKTALTK
jgi:hypothetical protein